jgi:hypothetical protein
MLLLLLYSELKWVMVLKYGHCWTEALIRKKVQTYSNIEYSNNLVENYGHLFSELWELMKKIGIMGTYLYFKIRNCGNLF